MIEILDILLKWFVLRFCESNTSCLLKVFRFLLDCLFISVSMLRVLDCEFIYHLPMMLCCQKIYLFGPVSVKSQLYPGSVMMLQ